MFNRNSCKKMLAAFLAGMMLVSASACQAPKDQNSSKNETTKGKLIEVTIPSYKSGENAGAVFFLPQVERFNKKYEGKYKLNIEECPQASYGEKLKQLAQQKKLPVIMHGTGSGEVDTQWFNNVAVKNNMCYDLSAWLEKNPQIKKLCIDKSLQYNTTADGKVVAMPLMVTRPKSIFYNSALYTPEKPISTMTMDEFVNNLGEKKIALQTADNGWCTGLLWTALIANEQGGLELLDNSVESMLRNFTAEPIVKATKTLQNIMMKNASSNTVGAAYADAANNFMSNKSQFIMNGTWMATDFNSKSSNKWSNGFDGSKVRADLFPGNIGLVTVQVHGDWISNTATAEEKELALAYFEFVYSQAELEAYMLSDGGTAPNMVYSEEFKKKQKETAVLSDLSNASNEKTRYAPVILDIMPTSVAEAEFGKLLPKLANGTLTPEQFCEQMTQKAKAAK